MTWATSVPILVFLSLSILDLGPCPCKLTISSHLFARWHLFRHVGYLRHERQVDRHVDLESGVRVTCDVGYLCANFSLPKPLYSRLRPDVRDRETDIRQTHRLMQTTLYGCLKNSQNYLEDYFFGVPGRSKQVFRPPPSHMSTDLDEIWQGYVVATNTCTLVGEISPRSVHGRLQAKRQRLCFL